MKPLVNRIILALALLLSQTASAVHDAECLDGAHDQTCEVFFAQDHSASAADSQNKVESTSHSGQIDSVTLKASPLVFDSCYLSRAPPQSL